MNKHIKKLSVRVMIAVMLGLLLASRTTIQAPCTTAPHDEDISKCVSYPDAISQPSKLVNNEQNSLVRLSTTFTITAITSFVVLSVYSWYTNRKPK